MKTLREYEKILPQIARKAVLEEFTGEVLINKEELYHTYPEFKEKRATFVTIETKEGELRGCIGTLTPHRPLLEDVIHNAKAAAFNDYRFSPMNLEEMEDVIFEVSILSITEEVNYYDTEGLRDKIIPYEHGVVLEYNGSRATFLPQVWEKLPDFDQFFAHLCLKAGLSSNCLELHPDIYRYTVTDIKE